MKTIEITKGAPSLQKVLQLALDQDVILRTEKGDRFVVAELDDFEEEIRQMLVLVKIRERVKASVPVTEEEVRRAYDLRFGEKTLDVAY